jgi:hypothetical protein
MKTVILCAGAVLALASCGATARQTTRPATTRVEGAPHIDPYRAAVAYAQCMRERGVAHPNPDANGDFHLTPAQERRMRASASPAQHEAGDKACFHFLAGTASEQPLSAAAKSAALVPLREVRSCLRGYGYTVGKPTVRNMSRGRAMFGFETAPPRPATAKARQQLQSAQHTCETRVKLAARIDAIVKADRGEGD